MRIRDLLEGARIQTNNPTFILQIKCLVYNPNKVVSEQNGLAFARLLTDWHQVLHKIEPHPTEGSRAIVRSETDVFAAIVAAASYLNTLPDHEV